MEKVKRWSEVNCRTTHYGTLQNHRRSTIQIGDNMHLLVLWSKGGGFNPPTQWFVSLDDAKQAGEAWSNSL